MSEAVRYLPEANGVVIHNRKFWYGLDGWLLPITEFNLRFLAGTDKAAADYVQIARQWLRGDMLADITAFHDLESPTTIYHALYALGLKGHRRDNSAGRAWAGKINSLRAQLNRT